MADLNYEALALRAVYMIAVFTLGAFLLTLVCKEYKKQR